MLTEVISINSQFFPGKSRENPKCWAFVGLEIIFTSQTYFSLFQTNFCKINIFFYIIIIIIHFYVITLCTYNYFFIDNDTDLPIKLFHLQLLNFKKG